MDVAELKYFETGNSPRRVKRNSILFNFAVLVSTIKESVRIYHDKNPDAKQILLTIVTISSVCLLGIFGRNRPSLSPVSIQAKNEIINFIWLLKYKL